MFEDPTENTSFIEPGRYCLKIVKLEPQPPSAEHPDWKPSVRLILNLATYPAMKLMLDKDQQPYEWFQYCSVAMGKGTRTRQWVEAFLGRELVEGQDTGVAIAEALLGAKAIAMVGPNTKGKDAILGALQPFKAPVKATAAKGAPASAAVATLEEDLPETQRAGAVAVADPDEDSFAF